MNAWQRAAAIAAGQRGVLSVGQAATAGLSADQLEYAVRHRGWRRVERGVYALPGSIGCWQRDAVVAQLLGGKDAVISHLTAAAAWGWTSAPPLPHITVPPSQSRRTPLARVHRSDVAGIDRATRDGIRCTSASRTLVDCAGVLERSRLEQFVDDALCGALATPESVLAAAGRAGSRGRAGVALLRSVLETWSEGIAPDSPAEARLVRRLEGLGVAGIVTQYEVRDGEGRFVARLDVAVPSRRHGFEYDSDRWHNPRRWAHDEPRYARLHALGWRVDPISKLDLLPSSNRLADLLAAAAA